MGVLGASASLLLSETTACAAVLDDSPLIAGVKVGAARVASSVSSLLNAFQITNAETARIITPKNFNCVALI
jgi:hypothetical protein